MDVFVRTKRGWRSATAAEVDQAPHIEVWLIEDGVDGVRFVAPAFQAETREDAEQLAWACGAAVALVVPADR